MQASIQSQARCPRASPAARAPAAVHGRVSRRGAVSVRAEIPKDAIVSPKQVKVLQNDRGYEFWDIRTPEENAEGAKRWMKNIPFAFMGESGPVLNKRFKAQFQQAFPNKMSRVILACDDGSDRSEMAYEMVEEMGYTSVKVSEGGISAYLEIDPLDTKDKAPKWKLVGQTSGVAEGGILEYLKIDPLDSKDKAPKWRLTGQTSGVRYAYNDGTFDDSA